MSVSARVHMPSLGGATEWLNSEPLGLAELRGRVVLVNFWTLTCINWLRQEPYVRAWSQAYRDAGLVVIGVHTPEFSFEHDIDGVRRATKERWIDYPVALDNDYEIWSAFANNYWPALYFVNADGVIRDDYFGEGRYEQSERVIQRLLGVERQFVAVEGLGVEAEADWDHLRTPETYLGNVRSERFGSPDRLPLNLSRTAATRRRPVSSPIRSPSRECTRRRDRCRAMRRPARRGARRAAARPARRAPCCAATRRLPRAGAAASAPPPCAPGDRQRRPREPRSGRRRPRAAAATTRRSSLVGRHDHAARARRKRYQGGRRLHPYAGEDLRDRRLQRRQARLLCDPLRDYAEPRALIHGRLKAPCQVRGEPRRGRRAGVERQARTGERQHRRALRSDLLGELVGVHRRITVNGERTPVGGSAAS
jgi:thiol-disulfide isomerase/thioredoxin